MSLCPGPAGSSRPIGPPPACGCTRTADHASLRFPSAAPSDTLPERRQNGAGGGGGAAMRLAIPDLISNSYFPALAAAELGFFAREGIEVSAELIFPVDRAYEALRDGEVDFVGGAAHGALAAFPEWRGVKLLGALAQGMHWFLVMRTELGIARGDLAALRGRRIGAAPWVEMGLRRLLAASGVDPIGDRIEIGPVPGATGPSINFGLTAAEALATGKIDGFWANGMAAELTVSSGTGTIVLDVR